MKKVLSLPKIQKNFMVLPYEEKIPLFSNEDVKLLKDSEITLTLDENYLHVRADYFALVGAGGSEITKHRIFFDVSYLRGSIQTIGVDLFYSDKTVSPSKNNYALEIDGQALWEFPEEHMEGNIRVKNLITEWNVGVGA